MVNYIVNRKAARVRLSNEMISQLAQVPIAIASARGLVRSRGNKSADAPACFDHAGALQLGINFSDGISVDTQLDRQLPHGRQLIAELQPPGRNRKANGPFQLRVKRGWMIGVYLKHRCPIVLRQWYK